MHHLTTEPSGSDQDFSSGTHRDDCGGVMSTTFFLKNGTSLRFPWSEACD